MMSSDGGFFVRACVCVAVKPEVEPFSITDSTLNEGGSTKILCSASSGDTPMHFSWTVDGRRLADAANGDRLKVQRLDELTSLLSLTKASPENAGNYSCVARNEAGSASRTATLKVMGKPIIRLPLHDRSHFPPEMRYRNVLIRIAHFPQKIKIKNKNKYKTILDHFPPMSISSHYLNKKLSHSF